MKYLNKKIINSLTFFFLVLVLLLALISNRLGTDADIPKAPLPAATKALPTPAITAISIPEKKLLNNSYHIFQSFNNCGPAALSMALSYYGISISQAELGQQLRPYQIPGGDNDDKSVTLDEVAERAKVYGLTPILRPMGTESILKEFIALDLPVITRTWTKPQEDIGHFRIVKGYDDATNTFIQDDSLQGKNLLYSYDDFNELWKKFNYEYLVLVPKEKLDLAYQVIGEDKDEKIAWKKAISNSQKELAANPTDIHATFNLSVAYFKTGDFQKSITEFEKIESNLPFRTLWYQNEPIQAYFEVRNYDKVFSITDKILNNQNRAYSELYILRGKSYQKLGKEDQAQGEFKKAVLYNANLKEAQDLVI